AVRQRLSAEDALQLRREGYNTLLVPVSAQTTPLWDAADRLGFLVLGRLGDTDAAWGQAESMMFHACCLGWVLPQDGLEHGAWPEAELAQLRSGSGPLLGVELDQPPLDRLPQGVHFLYTTEDFLSLQGAVHRPVLLRSPRAPGVHEEEEQALSSSEVLGW